MPETSFTRTISNPEVVMKRRRQQKLERRMQEFRSSDGRPDSGARARGRLLPSRVRLRGAGSLRLGRSAMGLVRPSSPVQLLF